MKFTEGGEGGPLLPPISKKRQARIKEVQNMYDAGIKVAEIAKFFGISKIMVFRDLKDAKELNRALVKNLDQDKLFGREISFLIATRRRAMRDYLSCQDGGAVKVGFLRTAITVHEKLMKLLQESGMVTKVAERFAFEDGIPFDDPEVRQAYLDWVKLARKKGEKNLSL